VLCGPAQLSRGATPASVVRPWPWACCTAATGAWLGLRRSCGAAGAPEWGENQPMRLATAPITRCGTQVSGRRIPHCGAGDPPGHLLATEVRASRGVGDRLARRAGELPGRTGSLTARRTAKPFPRARETRSSARRPMTYCDGRVAGERHGVSPRIPRTECGAWMIRQLLEDGRVLSAPGARVLVRSAPAVLAVRSGDWSACASAAKQEMARPPVWTARTKCSMCMEALCPSRCGRSGQERIGPLT